MQGVLHRKHRHRPGPGRVEGAFPTLTGQRRSLRAGGEREEAKESKKAKIDTNDSFHEYGGAPPPEPTEPTEPEEPPPLVFDFPVARASAVGKKKR